MLASDYFIELKATGKLPSPHGAGLKIIQLCQREDVSLPELQKMIMVDPAITGRLLKLANSSAFPRPRPVASLSADVLMSLGIEAIRQVVLVFSLIENYHKGKCASFDYDQFWSWSLATGVAAQLIGAATRIAPPAEMFTLGLLANIGRLTLAELYPDHYGKLLQEAGGLLSDDHRVFENKTFGFTHGEIAAALLREWGLPKLFRDAVMSFENPPETHSGATRSERLSAILHWANMLASLNFKDEGVRELEYSSLQDRIEEIGIDKQGFDSMYMNMLREWKSWSHVLEIMIPET